MAERTVRQTRYDHEYPADRTIVIRGHVNDDIIEYAHKRLDPVVDSIEEPVWFTRMKLTQARNPSMERPALAEITVDIEGEVVRAHVAASQIREAIDLLRSRLIDQLEHRRRRRQTLHRMTGQPEHGEWRRGTVTLPRPRVYERPVEERQLVARKTFAVGEMTLDEAVFDMEQLDHDFFLFRDLTTGDDALLTREEDGYHLVRLHPSDVPTGPTAFEVAVERRPVPTFDVDAAIEAMETAHQPLVFFADASTGRGRVLYHRYDGHYGLVTAS
jgi:ribosome-associated translation inhibitor RaiA